MTTLKTVKSPTIRAMYKRAVEASEKALAEKKKLIISRRKGLLALLQAGLLDADKKSITEWEIEQTYYSPRIDRKDLPALRKAVGKVEVTSKYPMQGEDEEGLVEVVLKLEDYPGLSVKYTVKIADDVDENGKPVHCKIKTVASTYRSLVCER